MNRWISLVKTGLGRKDDVDRPARERAKDGWSEVRSRFKLFLRH